MVERETLVRRLTLLEEYCEDLHEAGQNLDLEGFCQDKVVRRYVERTLHMAIEACLDIANHIISYEGYREPKDNKDTFEVLHFCNPFLNLHTSLGMDLSIALSILYSIFLASLPYERAFFWQSIYK